ncbi:hypothetical protein RQP46_007368 [Phenoliferia psychrophenolica]
MAAVHSPSITPSSSATTAQLRGTEFRSLKMPEISSSKVASSALVLVPVIGQFADSLHPSMQAYKKTWSAPFMAVSPQSIQHTSTTDVARRILNASTSAEPCLVRSAKQVLLPENWVFLNGKLHNEYRKGLNCLFTRKALAIYLAAQDRINRKFFTEWTADPSPAKPFMMIFRDLNMYTSLQVFCGTYVKDENVKEITEKYWLITRALELVNVPFGRLSFLCTPFSQQLISLAA